MYFDFFPLVASAGCGRGRVASIGDRDFVIGGDGGTLERARLLDRSVESDWKRLMTRCAPLAGLGGVALGDEGVGACEASGGVNGVFGIFTKMDVYPIAAKSGLKSWIDGVILLAVVGVSMKLRNEAEGRPAELREGRRVMEMLYPDELRLGE